MVTSRMHSPAFHLEACPNVRHVDPDRHLLPVSPSQDVDVRYDEAIYFILQRGRSRLELAATLLVPIGRRLQVDELKDDFAGRTTT